jgi:hypothetical protein
MGSYRNIVREQVWRLAAGLPLLAAGGYLLFTTGRFGAFAWLPFGLAGGILVGPLITELCAEPLRGLFYPRRYAARPAPMYGIPESKRAKGRYEEAIADYERIAAEYPGELRPYVGMIEIAIVNLRDPQRAARVFERGVAALEDPDARDALARVYSGVRTRMEEQPDWLEQQRKRVIRPGGHVDRAGEPGPERREGSR